MDSAYKIVSIVYYGENFSATGEYLSDGSVLIYKNSIFTCIKTNSDFLGKSERIFLEKNGKLINGILKENYIFSTAKAAASAIAGCDKDGKLDLMILNGRSNLKQYLNENQTKNVSLDKTLFCNISWMDYYAGTTDNDPPYSGADYVKRQKDAGEKINFANFNDGNQYGFVETKYVKGSNKKLEDLQGDGYKKFNLSHFGVREKSANYADGILVIFFARNPKDQKFYIVGYYKNATVYKERGIAPFEVQNTNLKYNLSCNKNDAYLIDSKDRKPLNCPVQLFFRQLFTYPREEKQNAIYYKQIIEGVLKFDKTKNPYDLSIQHKTWAIPCKVTYYRFDDAIHNLKEIWLKQENSNINPGDIGFIYISKPQFAYKYKCLIEKVDVPLSEIDTETYFKYLVNDFDTSKNIKFMRIFLLKEGYVNINDVYDNILNVSKEPNSQVILNEKYVDFIESCFEYNDKKIASSFADLDDTINDTYDSNICDKPAEEITKDGVTYLPRNEKTRKIALLDSNGICANQECVHDLFISKNGKPYLEAHHIIPISAYKDFPGTNIDIPENVVCLCPSCHKEIHFGADSKNMIIDLYNKRKNALEAKNIFLKNGIAQLLSYYGLED